MILKKNKKNIMCTLTGVLREVANEPEKISSAYFENMHIFKSIIHIFIQ